MSPTEQRLIEAAKVYKRLWMKMQTGDITVAEELLTATEEFRDALMGIEDD